MAGDTIEKLLTRMERSLLCVGLDPDLQKVELLKSNKLCSYDSKILQFTQIVIDATAPHVCAFKIQKAFFDPLPAGHDTLKILIKHIHIRYPEIPVFIDCKIGDIENTMLAYLDNLFGKLNADGIVVNPYMGDDVMKPMESYPDKAIIILVKTSNPGAAIVQDINLPSGKALWKYVLSLVVNS